MRYNIWHKMRYSRNKVQRRNSFSVLEWNLWELQWSKCALSGHYSRLSALNQRNRNLHLENRIKYTSSSSASSSIRPSAHSFTQEFLMSFGWWSVRWTAILWENCWHRGDCYVCVCVRVCVCVWEELTLHGGCGWWVQASLSLGSEAAL